MKLKELLTNTFGENVSYPNDQFRKLELESLKEELLKCDEFSECEGIEFMDMPTQEIDGTTYTSQTMKLGDNTKFDGKVFLYNLSFTPEMFDPNSLHTPVKNGALITPVLYDPMTFEPTKKIVLTWSPEMAQDVSGANDELTLRNDIHKLLDDVLDNPEEYRVKGERGIMVRGVFKTKNVDRKEPPYLIGTSMERDTSWDDPQLSDGDMPIRQQNALKNTFPDLEIQKEVEPQTQLEELNDYLRMLADMDKVGIRRKIVLLEGYIDITKKRIKNDTPN